MTSKMNRYYYSTKREFWEYKNAFVRLPVISTIAVSALMLVALIIYSSGMLNFTIEGEDLHFLKDSERPHFSAEIDFDDDMSREQLENAHQDLLRARDKLVSVQDRLQTGEKGSSTQKQDVENYDSDSKIEVTIDIDGFIAREIKAEASSEIAKEIEKLDHEIANVEAKLHHTNSMTPNNIDIKVPSPPTPPAPPSDKFDTGEIRTFPSNIESIGEVEDNPEFAHEALETANGVVKVIFIAFGAVMMLVSLYYLLSCLYADRKDNSILFWKSLPVSETQHVLIKFGVAVLVTPLIALAAAIVVSFAYAIIGSIFVATNSVSIGVWDFLSGLNIISYAITHWITTLSACLWCLPFFAWLIFCSAFAKRSPFLMATIPVIVIALLEKVVFNSQVFLYLFFERFPGAQLDGSTINYQMLDQAGIGSLGVVLGSVGTLIGAVITAALLYGAIWLRNHRYEL